MNSSSSSEDEIYIHHDTIIDNPNVMEDFNPYSTIYILRDTYIHPDIFKIIYRHIYIFRFHNVKIFVYFLFIFILLKMIHFISDKYIQYIEALQIIQILGNIQTELNFDQKKQYIKPYIKTNIIETMFKLFYYMIDIAKEENSDAIEIDTVFRNYQDYLEKTIRDELREFAQNIMVINSINFVTNKFRSNKDDTSAVDGMINKYVIDNIKDRLKIFVNDNLPLIEDLKIFLINMEIIFINKYFVYFLFNQSMNLINYTFTFNFFSNNFIICNILLKIILKIIISFILSNENFKIDPLTKKIIENTDFLLESIFLYYELKSLFDFETHTIQYMKEIMLQSYSTTTKDLFFKFIVFEPNKKKDLFDIERIKDFIDTLPRQSVLLVSYRVSLYFDNNIYRKDIKILHYLSEYPKNIFDDKKVFIIGNFLNTYEIWDVIYQINKIKTSKKIYFVCSSKDNKKNIKEILESPLQYQKNIINKKYLHINIYICFAILLLFLLKEKHITKLSLSTKSNG